jgi:hypothetical protein
MNRVPASVDAGHLRQAEVQPWLNRLETGPLVPGFSLYLVTALA